MPDLNLLPEERAWAACVSSIQALTLTFPPTACSGCTGVLIICCHAETWHIRVPELQLGRLISVWDAGQVLALSAVPPWSVLREAHC